MINIKPSYKLTLRYILMIILLIHIGFNIVEFKNNLTTDIKDYNENLDKEFMHNLSLNYDYKSLYDIEPKQTSLGKDMQRDIILLDTMFSLFLFIIIRYGRGVNDVKQ